MSSKREEKKKKTVKKEVTSVWKPRFIHEVYTQERLLRDAVAQEYLNKYSLVSSAHQTQLISMQESKKKVLHAGTLGEKIADPISYRSSLRDGMLITRITGDQDADLLEAYFQLPAAAENPAESQNRPAIRQCAAQEEQREFLGKRGTALHKAMRQSDAEEVQGTKYCDPQTGAYFSTLEEFRRIRQLRDLERESKIEKELQFLHTFMLSKKKKLNSLISESYD